MSQDNLELAAQNKKTGMQPDEILTAIGRAASAGFTILHKTRVGFAGQIQTMIFRRPVGGDHDEAPDGSSDRRGGAGDHR